MPVVGKRVNSRCGESPGFQKPAFGRGPAEPAGPYVMNISKTVDTIIDLRSRGAAPDERVAEHLRATLEAMGAHVDVQATHFSAFSGSLAMAAALALSVVFLLGVIKRRHRLAFVSAFAVALIIFFEFAIGWHVVSRPIQKRSENVVAHFPVQDAARRVIVGTQYTMPTGTAPGRFSATVSAFLLPMTLVMALLGLWQLAAHYGRFDFEDAHTIMMIMGSVCAIYYAVASGVHAKGAMPAKSRRAMIHNAGSVATLAALAEDLSQKYPRLQNTWVSVAFFGGGSEGEGAASFVRRLAGEHDRTLPTYYIGCDRDGMGGPHAYVIPAGGATNPLDADRKLIRTLNRAAVTVAGRSLEIVAGHAPDSAAFAKHGFPAVALATLSREGREGHNEEGGALQIDRGRLLLSLQLLETALVEFEKPRSP